MKIQNIPLHFFKVCKHRFWVNYYCRKVGLYYQGLTHDLSKFSPIEFWESTKYYQGGSSPIDACKKEKGWSKAWQHHKGRNPHHYEYWVDNYDNGGSALKMPYRYAAEMLCDYLGAGRAYYGKDFSYAKEYEWWLNKSKKDLLMHTKIKNFITGALHDLKMAEDGHPFFTNDLFWFNSDYLEAKYKYAREK